MDLREFEDFPANAHLEAETGKVDVERDDVLAIDTVSIDLNIQKSGEEYYCQGRVSGRVTMECARCLADYSDNVSCETDFIICSEAAAESRKSEAIDDEDYDGFDDDLDDYDEDDFDDEDEEEDDDDDLEDEPWEEVDDDDLDDDDEDDDWDEDDWDDDDDEDDDDWDEDDLD